MKKTTFIPKPRDAKAIDRWVEKRQLGSRPTKRLTVEVPADLHREVRMICVRDDLVLANVVRELLEAYVGRDKASTPASAS